MMASENKGTPFIEKEEQNLLAKKTLEHLQVISMAEIILKEKFAGNADAWMKALFEALTLRNPAYLLEERNTMENHTINLINLDNELKDSFWDNDNHDKVMSTGYQLINIFNKFMIGLNKNAGAFDFGNSSSQLKQIQKNINMFIMKANECNAEAPETSASQVGFTTKSKEPTKLSQSNVCTICGTKITIFNNDMDFSIDLHSQEAVHKKAMAKVTTVESDAKTATKAKSKFPDQIGGKFLVKHHSEADLLGVAEEHSIRAKLNQSIKNHSAFISILPRNEFFCKLCKCNISSIQNVESHVEGTKHTKAYELLTMKAVDNVFQVDDSSIPIAKLKI